MRAHVRQITAAACLVGSTLSVASAAAETKTIAIANFGSHPQLNAVAQGFQAAIAAADVDAKITVDHVNFDATLLPQMFSKIEVSDPDMIVSITTPVAQNMLNIFGDSGKPLLFGAVTDPVSAELVPSWDAGGKNITGVADALDIKATLEFINRLFPDADTVGVPFNPAEANDLATLKLFETHGPELGLKIESVGVDNTNDIMARVTSLSTSADVIYGPASNMIQPAIAAVATAATQMGKPVVNMDDGPVNEGLIPAGFTVSYYRIGEMVGEIAVRVLAGETLESISPQKPSFDDHSMVISRSAMASVGATIPETFNDCDCIVD
ncbi:MAG: ABC transporter substrate-binding protein [Aestuariivita sp.]|nr:ABC transporter substrate-binding protein [Aestuariivita sp.]